MINPKRITRNNFDIKYFSIFSIEAEIFLNYSDPVISGLDFAA
jgi:hypothetical protein